MDYAEINKEQKNKMYLTLKGDAGRTEHMEWEDSNLTSILTGKLPELRIPSTYNSKVESTDKMALDETASKMKKLINEFSYFETDEALFIQELEALNEVFSIHHSMWPGIDTYAYEYWIKLMRHCLILGEGGIGKTYFVFELEKALTDCRKKHLCIYGKYFNEISKINFEQIIEIAKREEFVFVVDAYNELSEENRSTLISFWKQNIDEKGLRIIVTLRTGTLSSEQYDEIGKIFDIKYKFRGVSFEAALELLKHLPITELYQYEDILYSNNALQLKMLHTVLQKATGQNKNKNSISRITYIIENYIKITTNRQIWLDTKEIGTWIYNHDQAQVPLFELRSLLKDVPRYLTMMNEIGLISTFTLDGIEYLVFNNESIMNYLVARNLFQDLSSLDACNQVNLIKRKVRSIHGLREAAILVIFDRCKNNYPEAYELLKNTNLLSDLNFDTLLKVNFGNHSKEFLRVFKINDSSALLPVFGGYSDKPFNCTNYLNKYYLGRKRQMASLSTLLSGQYQLSRTIDRLQHMLYFITVDNHANRNDDEIFYFALWCSAAPNENIRYLAIKLLYDLSCNSCHFQMILVDVFPKIFDPFIQESIIRVLTRCNTTNAAKNIEELFERLLTSDTFVLAKSLQLICNWKGDPYGYIRLQKKNLYMYNAKSRISKQLNNILIYADIYEKHLLKFRYWGSEHIDIYHPFIDADKNKVLAWNEKATKKFDCVRIHGEDSWCYPSKEEVMRFVPADFECNELPHKSFLSSFGKVIKKVYTDYGLPYSSDRPFDLDERSFKYSLTRKALIISQEMYYGSLMCNYFINSFECFNGHQNIAGYNVFTPEEYDDSTIHVTSPLPTFSSNVKELENRIIARIEEPDTHDLSWVSDMSISERNLGTLYEHIEYKGEYWVLIAGRVYLRGKNDNESEWADTYDYWICTSDSYMLDESKENRYLTIELPDYKGSMEQYTILSAEPHRCHSVFSIVYNSEVFQDTTLVLPPADIIKGLNLHVNIADITWRNEDEEIVVYCNNCKSSYFTDDMTGSVFIRERDLKCYLNGKKQRYFAYVEKRIPETGYADETSFHLQIQDGVITKRVQNSGNRNDPSERYHCSECQFDFNHDQVDYDYNVSVIINRYLGNMDE